MVWVPPFVIQVSLRHKCTHPLTALNGISKIEISRIFGIICFWAKHGARQDEGGVKDARPSRVEQRLTERRRSETVGPPKKVCLSDLSLPPAVGLHKLEFSSPASA